MQASFNSAAASEEGKRAGVPAREIASTLTDILAYFEATKQAHPRLLEALHHEARGWREKIPALKNATQDELEDFFGQPAPADVVERLAAAGLTREKTPEIAYVQNYQLTTASMTKRPDSYWPGDVIPTLHDFRGILAFDAYREKLDGLEGDAAKLLTRLDAFEGARGSRHAAGTSLLRHIEAYVASTPRHPSEAYVPPAHVHVDYMNAFHHTYSGYVSWRPSADMERVSAEVRRGHVIPVDQRSQQFAQEAAKFTAALTERAGIPATVEVKLGATYGDDRLVVTMDMADYLQRYIPIKKGEIEIDTSVPGSSFKGDISTGDHYYGYEPGKDGFYEVDDLLLSASALKRVAAEYPAPGLEDAAQALTFLRETGGVTETEEKLAALPGHDTDFIRLSPQRKTAGVTEHDGVYYSDCDFHNKVNACLNTVQAAVSGLPAPEKDTPREDVTGIAPFEHKGDIYLPRSEKSYQAALYMQLTHGAAYSWVIRDKEAEAKAAGKDMYIVLTSQLPEESRARAVADLYAKLSEDPADRQARAATVLKKNLRVKSPVTLRHTP